MPFPFTRFEIDLTDQTYQDFEINLDGQILIVANNIIPMGYPGLVRPTLTFDERTSPQIDIMPFSVFRFKYSKLWLNSTRIADNAGINVLHDVATNLVLLSSKSPGDLMTNFRDNLVWQIGNSSTAVVADGNSFEIPVPLGASICSIALGQDTIAGGIPSLEVRGISAIAGTAVTVRTIFHKESTDDFFFQFDCRGVETIFLKHEKNGATGNITNWVLNFYE